MARNVRYFQGSIPAAPSGVVVALINVIRDQILAHTQPAGASWELYDDRSGTNLPDYVLRSRGDRALGAGEGDTRLFFRVRRMAVPPSGDGNTIMLGPYQGWNLTTHTGTRTQLDGINWGLSDTAQIDWWCAGHEYGFVFVCTQSGAFSWWFVQQPVRTHIMGGYDG